MLHSQFGTEPQQVLEYALTVFKNGDRERGLHAREFDRLIVVFDRDEHMSYHAALAQAAAQSGKLRNDNGVAVPVGLAATALASALLSMAMPGVLEHPCRAQMAATSTTNVACLFIIFLLCSLRQLKTHSAPTVAAAPARLSPTPPVRLHPLFSAVLRKLTPTALSPLNTPYPMRITVFPGT